MNEIRIAIKSSISSMLRLVAMTSMILGASVVISLILTWMFFSNN